MYKQHPVIIDCDPGIDDSMALLMALNYPAFRVDLITTVFGNVSTNKNTRNTLHLLEIFEKSVPVAKGVDYSLSSDYQSTKAHSENGLGNYVYDKINTFPLATIAHEAMYKVLVSNQKTKTTIICLGPLTNIALLLRHFPDCKKLIKEIIFMGGQKDDVTKTTPYREFNIASDSIAANIVLTSKIPLKMVPMDLGHMAYFTVEECKKIGKTNKIGKIFAKMFENYKDFHVSTGAAVHDACAVVQAMSPSLIKTEKAFIKIENLENFGYIKVDLKAKKPNAKIAMDINIDEFKNEFFKILNYYTK